MNLETVTVVLNGRTSDADDFNAIVEKLHCVKSVESDSNLMTHVIETLTQHENPNDPFCPLRELRVEIESNLGLQHVVCKVQDKDDILVRQGVGGCGKPDVRLWLNDGTTAKDIAKILSQFNCIKQIEC